jgi:transcriptional antiterminator RfaH
VFLFPFDEVINDENQLLYARHWYAFYTRSRHEFKAAEQLTEEKIQYYLPTISKVRQWSDRKKKVVEPLIRGYIFVYASEKERIAALQQNCMVRCVTFDGKPAVIPDWQIDNLKTMLSTESEFFITESIHAGTKVEIIDGPFKGVIGMVNNSSNGKMLSVTIELLSRSVNAYLPQTSVIRMVVEK